MAKLFDVGNKNQTGMFIVARDADHALEIAQKFGHIKDKKNGRPHEMTDLSDDNLEDVVNSGQFGQLCKRITAYTFDQILSGNKPAQPTNPWEFMRTV